MDDEFFVTFWLLAFILPLAVCAGYGTWWPIIIIGIIGGLALFFVGMARAMDALVLAKNRRKDRAEEARKAAQEAAEALVERALTQHVLLEMGLVDNRPDKLVKGIHGDYLPHQLDWPEGLTA